MFGTNPIRKQRLNDGSMLFVQTVFPTIQGEGPYAGVPAVFLRLGGCNLRCYFCDTDFESKREEMSVFALTAEIQKQAMTGKKARTKLVVITGGEPFLQNIVPLCKSLIDLGYEIQIETAGTLWNEGFEMLVIYEGVTLVCSPKTGKVHEKIAQFCHDWKYLVREGAIDPDDGLPNQSTQHEGVALRLYRPERKDDVVWLQPCEAYDVKTQKISADNIVHIDEMSDQKVTSSVRDLLQSQKNVTLAAQLAMKYNYRVSYQLHKVLGLP